MTAADWPLSRKEKEIRLVSLFQTELEANFEKGEQVFAHSHLDNVVKVALPATPNTKGQRTSLGVPEIFDISDDIVAEEVLESNEEGALGSCQARQRSKSARRRQSTGTLRKPSIGPRASGRSHRSKSRRRSSAVVKEQAQSSTVHAAQLEEKLVGLASQASELEQAQKRLAQLEEASAQKRLAHLEESIAQKKIAWQLEKSIAQCKAETAKQEADEAVEQRFRELEAAQHELKESKERIALELALLKELTSDAASRTCELKETRGKVDGLEHTMADQAAQIMSLTSSLVSDLSQLEASGCKVRDSVGQPSEPEDFRREDEGVLVEHELDLSGLRNVCASLYGQKTALELDGLSIGSESSLALLADLARRFPLCAGGGGMTSSPEVVLESPEDLWERVD